MTLKDEILHQLPEELNTLEKYNKVTESIETYEHFTKVFDSILEECFPKFEILDLSDLLHAFTSHVCFKFCKDKDGTRIINFGYYAGDICYRLVEKHYPSF